MRFIRNFCILAHIDHGKSTLADRLLEYTHTISRKKILKTNQYLDNLEIERKRGITIKSHPIQMEYTTENKKYILNLIDTPGHVDFSYEVERSISACEGVLLLVDATKGIQAQTISKISLAVRKQKIIIPIINKIDLPTINIDNLKKEIINLLKCNWKDILCISAKKGTGIKKVLYSLINKIPAPNGNKNEPLQALIFDSVYNSFRGVQIYFRIINGKIYKGQKIKFLSNNKNYYANEIGVFKNTNISKNIVSTGNVGYLIPGIKNPSEIKIGDTLTDAVNPNFQLIKVFKKKKPRVYAGIYPSKPNQYKSLKNSLEKLYLNDSSLFFRPETTSTFGLGFRCGFLGSLHMEIIKERLEKEYNLKVILTIPNVKYKITLKNHEVKFITSPSTLPDKKNILFFEEPYVITNIITKSEFIGPVIELVLNRRGKLLFQRYLTANKIELLFELPFSEIIMDFYDKLKSISKGYASFNYESINYKKSDLVKINILINRKLIDAFSMLIERKKALTFAKKICNNLSKLIPKKQFEIPIQATIEKKVVCRINIKPFRKDVISKCYGGDISRKRKLLEKQKIGKKKLRIIGNLSLPKSTYISIFKKVN
ncbi:Elongation factor 4 [Candidatus Karelsulcia muelleri]|uniref:translation elongation factor 4 n=1 Tax=Candidatus Karelsulcia muelleri TaxID=336810 RepID=UPI001FF12C82|nr:translation elongation factor 4 [Candidatus Karelsulcia muelleri]UOQ32927.1 Elongation factor 4 [Candidatus Karelsulcia muelleri]